MNDLDLKDFKIIEFFLKKDKQNWGIYIKFQYDNKIQNFKFVSMSSYYHAKLEFNDHYYKNAVTVPKNWLRYLKEKGLVS